MRQGNFRLMPDTRLVRSGGDSAAYREIRIRGLQDDNVGRVVLENMVMTYLNGHLYAAKVGPRGPVWMLPT